MRPPAIRSQRRRSPPARPGSEYSDTRLARRSDLRCNPIFEIVASVELRIAVEKDRVEIGAVDCHPGKRALQIAPGGDGQGSLVEYAERKSVGNRRRHDRGGAPILRRVEAIPQLGVDQTSKDFLRYGEMSPVYTCVCWFVGS
jgi:hypothetical protein